MSCRAVDFGGSSSSSQLGRCFHLSFCRWFVTRPDSDSHFPLLTTPHPLHTPTHPHTHAQEPCFSLGLGPLMSTSNPSPPALQLHSGLCLALPLCFSVALPIPTICPLFHFPFLDLFCSTIHLWGYPGSFPRPPQAAASRAHSHFSTLSFLLSMTQSLFPSPFPESLLQSNVCSKPSCEEERAASSQLHRLPGMLEQAS